MECFRRMKFRKRARNRKRGFIRGILKCLVPCIRQKSRSPSPRRSRSPSPRRSRSPSPQRSRSPSPRRSRSPSPERIIRENKSQENRKETSHRWTGAYSESMTQSGSQQEHLNFWEMSCGEEKFWRKMWNVGSPRSAQFGGITFGETEQDRRREEEDLCARGFEVLGHLGAGSFGKVLLVRKKWKWDKRSEEEKLALKIVPHQRVHRVEEEVFVTVIGEPFLVQLVSSFSTEESLCYVMEYLEGGTLQSLLSRLKWLREDDARFYMAELVLAVIYLHSCGIIHRDIKPTNILLDSVGHLKLADFGLCEVGIYAWNKTAGCFGTFGYMAPEVYQGLPYGPEVDWFSIGCVMQDMVVGKRSRSEVNYHPGYLNILTPDALSILKGFLDKDPMRRLGAHGNTRSIMNHAFFKGVNWHAVFEKRVTPPVNPLTLTFLTVEPNAPGIGDNCGRNVSDNIVHCEAIVETPPRQPLTVNCPTTDPGAHGAPDESGSSISFKTALEGPTGHDDTQSTDSFKTAVECLVLEGLANTPQIVTDTHCW